MDDTRTEEEDRAQGVFVRKLVAAVVAVVVAAFAASWAARTGWEIAGRKPDRIGVVWDLYARDVSINPVILPAGAHYEIIPPSSTYPAGKLLVILDKL